MKKHGAVVMGQCASPLAAVSRRGLDHLTEYGTFSATEWSSETENPCPPRPADPMPDPTPPRPAADPSPALLPGSASWPTPAADPMPAMPSDSASRPPPVAGSMPAMPPDSVSRPPPAADPIPALPSDSASRPLPADLYGNRSGGDDVRPGGPEQRFNGICIESGITARALDGLRLDDALKPPKVALSESSSPTV